MDVSVIIVNYNTCKMTNEAIDSVYEHTSGIDFEIILVDNASVDGSKEFFEKKNGITYIYSQENLGFGKGNNLGLKYAKGRNILFLNSDTLLRNNAIKILSDYMDANPDVGVCGGNLYDYEGKAATSFERKRPGIIRESNSLLNGKLYKLMYGKNTRFNNTTQPLSVGYISGADLMTRKEILQKVGSFSPEFFMYYEETELCDRIAKAGYKIVSVPNAEIVHLEGKSMKTTGFSTFNERKCQWMYESLNIYMNKCLSKIEKRFVLFLLKLKINKDILVCKIKNKHKLEEFKIRKKIIKQIK